MHDVSFFLANLLGFSGWTPAFRRKSCVIAMPGWESTRLATVCNIASSLLRIPIEANPRDVLSQAKNVRSSPRVSINE